MKGLVLVGTTPFGWDELTRSVDQLAPRHPVSWFAQVGNGRYLPNHLEWERFVSHDEVVQRMRQADICVIHGGLGSIGDALRHAARLVVVPRDRGKGRHGRQEAPNDQWPVAVSLSAEFSFECVRMEQLSAEIGRLLGTPVRQAAAPQSDAHETLSRWLTEKGGKVV